MVTLGSRSGRMCAHLSGSYVLGNLRDTLRHCRDTRKIGRRSHSLTTETLGRCNGLQVSASIVHYGLCTVLLPTCAVLNVRRRTTGLINIVRAVLPLIGTRRSHTLTIIALCNYASDDVCCRLTRRTISP